MSKINVAYLIDTIATDKAGTQKQLISSIKRLNRDQFDPVVVVLYESDWMKENSLPCPSISLGFRGFLKFNIPRVLSRLRDEMAVRRIDVLHAYFPESILVAYLSLAGRSSSPHLVSSRRDIGLGTQNEPWYHSIYRAISPTINKSFSGIIANSHIVADFVSKTERTPISKIKVIYNGVDLPTHARPGGQGDGSETISIVIAASLTPVKRHDVILESLAILSKKPQMPKFRLVLLGDGSLREPLEQLASKLQIAPLVEFRGAVDDVFSSLSNMHLGVLCSDREGLSNAILEYMAAELPVVATNVGGNKELVSDDTGILVPADNPDALADAIAVLACDSKRCEELGSRARTVVENNFSWSAAMRSQEDYYRTMVDS